MLKLYDTPIKRDSGAHLELDKVTIDIGDSKIVIPRNHILDVISYLQIHIKQYGAIDHEGKPIIYDT